MANRWLRKSKLVIYTSLMFALLFVIACGQAAAPDTPAMSEKEVVQEIQVEKEPVVEKEVVKEMEKVAAAEPTAVPAPPAVTVNPGKVTWMVGGWANERFDYVLSSGGDPGQYGRILHGFMLEISDDFELVPGIATDWGLSPDGLTWSFTIREGVKYHDGTEVTMEDVLWTWDHYFGPDSGDYAVETALRPLTRIRDRVEQTGPNQVSLTTTQPQTGIPDYFFSRRGPLFAGVMPAQEKQYDQAAAAAYQKAPVGTGVMKLVRHVPLEVMEFERFDDYYYQPDYGLEEDRRVSFTTFEQRLVPEESTRVAAIRSGEADIAPVSLQSKEQVEQGGGRLIFGREGVYFNAIFEICWSDPELFCYDKRVRQALAYAIDKELIRDRLYGSEVMEIKGWSYISPSTIGYSPEVDPFPFDPDKARQLLAEAGYRTPTNPQGKDPGTFIINAIVATSLPQLPELAQLIAAMWERELGIDVEVKVGDRTAIKQLEQALEIPGQLFLRDNETRVNALSNMRSQYGDPERKYRRQNDPEVMTWVDEIIAMTDPAAQAEAANKLYRHLRDEQHELGLGYVNIPWAVGPRILSWEPRPLSLYPSALHKITLK